MSTAFLMLGTNLGDKKKNLAHACQLIEEKAGRITAKSLVYETEPWGFEDDTSFLNQAIKVETTLLPLMLLATTMKIEAQFGRLRGNVRYAPRSIDIDILFYNELIISLPELILPHPEIQYRRFVLEPMAEIAPGLVHPRLKKKISELLEICSDEKTVNVKKD